MCVPQYSPSNSTESETVSEVLDFSGGERFGEHVSDHVGGGAINKTEGALLDHPANEMVADVDVLGPRVIAMVLRESDRSLIVREEYGGFLDRGGEDVF